MPPINPSAADIQDRINYRLYAKCAVPSCKSKYAAGLRFFKFRLDPLFTQLWLENLKMREQDINSSTRICSQHFIHPQDFTEKGHLLKGAMPTQNLPHTPKHRSIYYGRNAPAEAAAGKPVVYVRNKELMMEPRIVPQQSFKISCKTEERETTEYVEIVRMPNGTEVIRPVAKNSNDSSDLVETLHCDEAEQQLVSEDSNPAEEEIDEMTHQKEVEHQFEHVEMQPEAEKNIFFNNQLDKRIIVNNKVITRFGTYEKTHIAKPITIEPGFNTPIMQLLSIKGSSMSTQSRACALQLEEVALPQLNTSVLIFTLRCLTKKFQHFFSYSLTHSAEPMEAKALAAILVANIEHAAELGFMPDCIVCDARENFIAAFGHFGFDLMRRNNTLQLHINGLLKTIYVVFNGVNLVAHIHSDFTRGTLQSPTGVISFDILRQMGGFADSLLDEALLERLPIDMIDTKLMHKLFSNSVLQYMEIYIDLDSFEHTPLCDVNATKDFLRLMTEVINHQKRLVNRKSILVYLREMDILLAKLKHITCKDERTLAHIQALVVSVRSTSEVIVKIFNDFANYQCFSSTFSSMVSFAKPLASSFEGEDPFIETLKYKMYHLIKELSLM